MEEDVKNEESGEKKAFKVFAMKRIIAGVLIAIVLLWTISTILGFFSKPPTTHTKTIAKTEQHEPTQHTLSVPKTVEHEKPIAHKPEEKPAPVVEHHETKTEPEKHLAVPRKVITSKGKGALFVNALIKPLDYEMNERFWGWRPNDIIQITDNVNNYQKGVLEVTRRTTVVLAEKISRTGGSSSFNENLEAAMNWFMVKSDKYWFPSAESKYNEGLDELRTYLIKLDRKEVNFYNRADNLIPLLESYQDLLGSCDENLVKQFIEGREVTFFTADNYFYYAKGVASSMIVILEAVKEDFHETLGSSGIEILDHAIESCHHADHINPWIVFESDLSSIFANHRANMAAPISHARFYLNVLAKALSP